MKEFLSREKPPPMRCINTSWLSPTLPTRNCHTPGLSPSDAVIPSHTHSPLSFLSSLSLSPFPLVNAPHFIPTRSCFNDCSPCLGWPLQPLAPPFTAPGGSRIRLVAGIPCTNRSHQYAYSVRNVVGGMAGLGLAAWSNAMQCCHGNMVPLAPPHPPCFASRLGS